MKLNDVKNGDVILGIIKGENGTGKSIAAASFAEIGPTYVFDWEDRMRSVANYYRRINRQDIIDNIEFDSYTSFFKVRKKIQALQSNPRGIKNIIWDSLTSFTLRVLANTKEFKQENQEKSGDKSGKTIGEFRVNTMEDFNAESSAIYEFVIEHAMIFKAMGINFILTAHVIKVSEPGDDGKTGFARYLMSGGKKAGQIIPGYYDEVYHTNIEPGMSMSDAPKYTVRTRHSGLDTAKTSMNLPPKLDFTDKSFYSVLKPYIPVQPVRDPILEALKPVSPFLVRE